LLFLLALLDLLGLLLLGLLIVVPPLVLQHLELLADFKEVFPLKATVNVESELLQEGTDEVVIEGLARGHTIAHLLSNLTGELREILVRLQNFGSSHLYGLLMFIGVV
jgi:hypothetical protein